MLAHHAPGGLLLPPPPRPITPTVRNSPSEEAQGPVLLEAKATIQSISQNNSQLRERFRILQKTLQDFLDQKYDRPDVIRLYR
jgi:hypothetical protein